MVDLQLIIDLYEKMENINTSDVNDYIYKMHSKKTKQSTSPSKFKASKQPSGNFLKAFPKKGTWVLI